MASVSPHRLLAPTSKAPKCPNHKFPKVTPSLFFSAVIHCENQHSNPYPTSRDESSLHHFRTHSKAFALVSRSGSMRRDAMLGWSVGAGETSSIKSVIAFYPEEASNSNVSVTIIGVGPDFTTLGSFGKVDAFAETLVNGLDRSWQRPPGIAAKLINSAAANGLYYIEYTLQNPGESCRHLFSAIGIASNGWYNRLYTVTGQFMDDEVENYKSLIEKVYIVTREMANSPLGLKKHCCLQGSRVQIQLHLVSEKVDDFLSNVLFSKMYQIHCYVLHSMAFNPLYR